MDQVGGFRSGVEGSEDYDLILRATEATDRIGHAAEPSTQGADRRRPRGYRTGASVRPFRQGRSPTRWPGAVQRVRLRSGLVQEAAG